MSDRDTHGRFIKGHVPTIEAVEKIRVAHIGKSPWNKGTKGLTKANSTSFKKGQESQNKGKFTSNSYSALHKWVARSLGRATECEWCLTKTAKKYEWANKSHEYKRDLQDWLQLCTSCHRKHDYDSYH